MSYLATTSWLRPVSTLFRVHAIMLLSLLPMSPKVALLKEVQKDRLSCKKIKTNARTLEENSKQPTNNNEINNNNNNNNQYITYNVHVQHTTRRTHTTKKIQCNSYIQLNVDPLLVNLPPRSNKVTRSSGPSKILQFWSPSINLEVQWS